MVVGVGALRSWGRPSYLCCLAPSDCCTRLRLSVVPVFPPALPHHITPTAAPSFASTHSLLPLHELECAPSLSRCACPPSVPRACAPPCAASSCTAPPATARPCWDGRWRTRPRRPSSQYRPHRSRLSECSAVQPARHVTRHSTACHTSQHMASHMARRSTACRRLGWRGTGGPRVPGRSDALCTSHAALCRPLCMRHVPCVQRVRAAPCAPAACARVPRHYVCCAGTLARARSLCARCSRRLRRGSLP